MQNTTLCPVGRLLRFLVMSPHYPLHAPCRQGKTPCAVVANLSINKICVGSRASGISLNLRPIQKTGRRFVATHLAQVKPRPDSLHYFHLRQHVHFSIIIRAFARKTFVSPRALHRPPCHKQQKRPHSPQARQKNAKTGRRLHLAPRPAMRQSRPTSTPPRSRLRHWSKVPAPQEAQDR